MNKNSITINIQDDPPVEEVDLLRAALRAYNQSAAGQNTYTSLYLKATSSDGEFIGGIYGKIAWQWLYIDLLWVHPHYRGRGLGSQLISSIEKAANEQGIFRYHLSTASFQAPDFYQKLGYEICGTIEDLPPGHTNYFLKKTDL